MSLQGFYSFSSYLHHTPSPGGAEEKKAAKSSGKKKELMVGARQELAFRAGVPGGQKHFSLYSFPHLCLCG